LLDALKKDQCHDQEIKDRLLKSKSIDRNFEVGSIVVLSITRIAKLLKKRKGSTDWDALLESWMSLMVPTN